MATRDEGPVMDEQERQVRAALHEAVGDVRPSQEGWERLQWRMRAHRAASRRRVRLLAVAAILVLAALGVVAGWGVFNEYESPRPEGGIDISAVNLDQFSGPLEIITLVVADDLDAAIGAINEEAANREWLVEEIPPHGGAVHREWQRVVVMPREDLRSALYFIEEIADLERITRQPAREGEESSSIIVLMRQR